MIKILNSTVTKKGIHEVTFENYEGEIYIIGFASKRFVGQEFHLSFMIANSLPSSDEKVDDYISYVTKRIGELLNPPLYLIRDKDQERTRIGASIRSIREQKKMEAKELAQKADLDAANLSRIEQGKFSTGIDTLAKIATALNSKVEIVPSSSAVIKGGNKRNATHILIQQILTEDISELAKDTNLFYGADIIISEKPHNNELYDWYGKVNVVTPYARELSWLFCRLRDIYSDNIEYWNREPFFGCMANAALDFIKSDNSSLIGLMMAVIAQVLVFDF